MAGVKGKSGGARRGAGRKAYPPEKLNTNNPISVTEVSPSADELIGERLAQILLQPKQDKIITPREETLKAMQTCDMRNLVCPIEFEGMPFAKKAWEYVRELDEHSKYHLLNERHFEAIKSYCLAVEMRQNLIAEWERQGKPTTILTRRGEIRVNPIITEVTKQSDKINNYAADLGLTVLSEFEMAKKVQSSPTLNGEQEEKTENLFD